METGDNDVLALDNLIDINAERVEKYKHAGYAITDLELKSVFYAIADESRKNISDMSLYMLRNYGLNKKNDSVRAHKIYDYSESSEVSQLLNSFEFCEVAVISAYAVAQTDVTHETCRELLGRQLESIHTSLKVIKSYRQAYSNFVRALAS